MSTIKLTAKRQATLPRELCDELKLAPGDAILVRKRVIGGKVVWCLEPIDAPDLAWTGRFKKQARGKRHDLASIRRSIARARKRGDG
jgi:bifunctional DNA-binding transcriptional regulator/antitoxin component of YhaV-PrlF toxin-antitoxin module